MNKSTGKSEILKSVAVGVLLGAAVALLLFESAVWSTHPGGSPAISAYASTPGPGPVLTPPSLSTVEEQPLTPMAYLPDGTSTDVATLLRLINAQRAQLPDDPFFAWVHSYLAQTTIKGTVWVRFSDEPMGSVSWLSRDNRPQLMLMGCREAVPLGYHDITLTTSNVACLNGECLFMAMPLSVDGR